MAVAAALCLLLLASATSLPAAGISPLQVVLDGVTTEELWVCSDRMTVDPASGWKFCEGDARLRVRSIEIQASRLGVGPQGGPQSPFVVTLEQPPRGSLRARAAHVAGSGTLVQTFTGNVELVAPGWKVKSDWLRLDLGTHRMQVGVTTTR